MELGTVSSSNYEDGVVYCDVEPVRYDEVYRERPVMKSHSGFIEIPKQGETVAMQQLKDGTRFISHVVSRRSENPDSMSEGEIAIQLDENTRISFEKTDSGHDVQISASGDVYIDDIAFADHTHDYSWTDKSGSDQTGPPK